MTRRVLLMLGLVVLALTGSGIAWAFWSAAGAGTSSAVTGTLNPPTNVNAVASPGIGTVSVSWTASPQATGYYVTRVRNSDSTSAAACGTSPSHPTTSTSCDDPAVADGTYHYTVTAVLATWTALSAPSANVTVNNTRPSVTVNQASGQADPTATAPVNFTAVFSETVSDFTSSDVTVSPNTATATVTGSGTTYNIAVSGLTTSGTVSVTIAANVAHDSAGAGNTTSTSTDNAVVYDITAPTAPTPTATAAVTFGSFVNSEPVTFTSAATDANSGVASVAYYYCAGATGSCTSANWTAIGSSTAASSSFPVTSHAPLAADGTYRIVAVATDAAGNVSTPSPSTQLTVDTTAPTITRPTVNGHS
ncbi:Ig-like domain-containing protein [Kribbella sp. NPDC004536]|uniref:Ig-like domain-containing protein n=1 Tax=Kribbella sp. NPDC004536 TaxID=3364106 RepID=UPI0036B8C782